MEVNLHDTTDASAWAKEFCKRWPSALCQIEGKEGVEDGDRFEGIMIGWFANAIMAGVDSERSRIEALTADNERLQARVAVLEEALRPFASVVFNDNGDMTLDTSWLKSGDYKRAYFLLKETGHD